jgi:hypothetical protein
MYGMRKKLKFIASCVFIGLLVCSCNNSRGNSQGLKGMADSIPELSTDTFHVTLQMDSVTFIVSCPNNSSLNIMTVEVICQDKETEDQRIEIDGTVTNALIADSDKNGHPELYCFVASAGSGSYGKVYGFASTKSQGLSIITLPEIIDDDQLSAGYRGHDQFSMEDNFLMRRFPVYRPDDSNAEPTGGNRLIMYELVSHEKGFFLKPVGFENYE